MEWVNIVPLRVSPISGFVRKVDKGRIIGGNEKRTQKYMPLEEFQSVPLNYLPEISCCTFMQCLLCATSYNVIIFLYVWRIFVIRERVWCFWTLVLIKNECSFQSGGGGSSSLLMYIGLMQLNFGLLHHRYAIIIKHFFNDFEKMALAWPRWIR
jgi:hypothetical protein